MTQTDAATLPQREAEALRMSDELARYRPESAWEHGAEDAPGLSLRTDYQGRPYLLAYIPSTDRDRIATEDDLALVEETYARAADEIALLKAGWTNPLDPRGRPLWYATAVSTRWIERGERDGAVRAFGTQAERDAWVAAHDRPAGGYDPWRPADDLADALRTINGARAWPGGWVPPAPESA